MLRARAGEDCGQHHRAAKICRTVTHQRPPGRNHTRRRRLASARIPTATSVAAEQCKGAPRQPASRNTHLRPAAPEHRHPGCYIDSQHRGQSATGVHRNARAYSSRRFGLRRRGRSRHQPQKNREKKKEKTKATEARRSTASWGASANGSRSPMTMTSKPRALRKPTKHLIH